MNNFSINRFGKTLRWVVSVDFRSLMMWTIGYSIAVFLGEMLFFYLSNDRTTEQIISYIVQFCSIFIVIALGVIFSTAFAGLNKRPRREAFLMLPATNLEKYLSVLAYVTIVWTVCVFLSIAVGDTLRMIVRSVVYGDPWVSGILPLLKSFIPGFGDTFFIKHTLAYKVMNITVASAFVVWLHSLYILGGTLLRRYAFVVASVIFVLCMMSLSWLIYHYQMPMFSSSWVGDHYEYQEVGTLAYVLAVVLPLLSVFNYWASFRIFKGFQLITNKWTNYDFFKR